MLTLHVSDDLNGVNIADCTQIEFPVAIDAELLNEMIDKDFSINPSGWRFRGYVVAWAHGTVSGVPGTILFINVLEDALVNNLHR